MSHPTYENQYTTEVKVGDKTIHLTIGKFSEQVSAAVLAQCGETVVHTTVALGRQVDLGYFPLQVEFAEKLYAAGIIKGSRWVKRDGRPTDEAVLKARVIDRTMRPMFTNGITHEVQIINTVFSYDGENDPDVLALLAAGVGLEISEIPFEGPVAGLRVGYSKTEQRFMFNPTVTEREASDLDLIVSGTAESIVMVEAAANEIPEDVMVEALVQAHQQLQTVSSNIAEIRAEIGKEKVSLVAEPDHAVEEVKTKLHDYLLVNHRNDVTEVIRRKARLEPAEVDPIIESVMTSSMVESHNAQDSVDMIEITEGMVKGMIDKLIKELGREMMIKDKVRPDGRQPDEIRSIWCEVDVFPRNHGSAMFKRGATQAITVTTLGAPSLAQLVEDMGGEHTHHYMHHYNMPPYASGEVGRFGAPKRREIGHGALAQRALLPMIPAQKDFPYTIHVVSEIVSSNGSTSQASICGSTMSLMAAGVPIKRPVAGIAMGLVSDGSDYTILSDIQGLEDHVGDMDFKVAGTTEGITAIQMDIKLKGLPRDILIQALEQARIGRLHILDKMLACIPAPRTELSQFAPKIEQLEIPGDRIGELIGPGGKMIKYLIEESGAEIDVDENEDGTLGIVIISSPDQAKIDAAATMVTNMMRTVELGEQFQATITRVEGYGAFAEYLPGREGLIHISNMSEDFVDDAASLVSLGQEVTVWIGEIKDDGKIGLTMLDPSVPRTRESRGRGPRDGGGRNRGGGGYRGGRDDRRWDDRRGGDRPGRKPFQAGRNRRDR